MDLNTKRYAAYLVGVPGVWIESVISDGAVCFDFSTMSKLTSMPLVKCKQYVERLVSADYWQVKNDGMHEVSYQMYDIQLLTLKKLTKALAKGFVSSWTDEEVKYCDWEFLFTESLEKESFKLGKEMVESIIVARVAGRKPGGCHRVVINGKFFLESSGHLKAAKRFTEFYKFDLVNQPIEKKNKELSRVIKLPKKKAKKRFSEKNVKDWSDLDFMDYVKSIDDSKDTEVLVKHAIKRGIINNGAKRLGEILQTSDLASSKAAYRTFIDWLFDKSKMTVSPGHFTSAPTFYLYRSKISKKNQHVEAAIRPEEAW